MNGRGRNALVHRRGDHLKLVGPIEAARQRDLRVTAQCKGSRFAAHGQIDPEVLLTGTPSERSHGVDDHFGTEPRCEGLRERGNPARKNAITHRAGLSG